MFVPFIYCLETGGRFDDLHTFIELMHFAINERCPVIAPENYFNKSGINKDVWAWALSFNKLYYDFGDIEQTDLDNAKKYMIPDKLRRDAEKAFGSTSRAWKFMLENAYEPLRVFIADSFDDIEKTEKIEGVLCKWVPKSLELEANKRGICILSHHPGFLRLPFYKYSPVHFDRKSSLLLSEMEDRYNKFVEEIKINPVPLLSREGILKLFVSDDNQDKISQIYAYPEYEAGVLFNLESAPIIKLISGFSESDIMNACLDKWQRHQLNFRARPGYTAPFTDDNSSPSFDFLCKCRRIAGIASNVFLEAALVGREVISYGNYGFTFICTKEIDGESKGIPPLEFANFLIFCYEQPIENILDIDYLRWFISYPSERKIYMRNFNYWTRHLSPEQIKNEYQGEHMKYNCRLNSPVSIHDIVNG